MYFNPGSEKTTANITEDNSRGYKGECSDKFKEKKYAFPQYPQFCCPMMCPYMQYSKMITYKSYKDGRDDDPPMPYHYSSHYYYGSPYHYGYPYHSGYYHPMYQYGPYYPREY